MTHRLDGKFSKDRTKDCGNECMFYELIIEHGRSKSHPCYMSGDEIPVREERCYCGVAWKKIVPTEKPRKCQYLVTQ